MIRDEFGFKLSQKLAILVQNDAKVTVSPRNIFTSSATPDDVKKRPMSDCSLVRGGHADTKDIYFRGTFWAVTLNQLVYDDTVRYEDYKNAATEATQVM